MAMSFEQRLIVSPDVLVRVIGEEAVLLNLETELYLGLDPVGTRMWTVLQEAPSISHGFDRLLAEFDVESEVLRRDVEEFIGELLAQSLIELKPA